MTLDLQKFDALDWIEDDDDLAFLLDDALSSADSSDLERVIALIERAKALTVVEGDASVSRLLRAARAVGRKVVASPLAGDDRRAA